MAEYKSYAPKGSFAAFQIAAADTSKEIEREANRQIQGMRAAQSFKERSDSIYEQALAYKFKSEEQQREANYKREVDDRRIHQEMERQNYQTQIQAEAEAAKRKQKVFGDLAQFSQTAFKAYGQIDETLKKNERAALHQIALETGMNIEDLNALRGIDQKLSLSQFSQLEFVQQKIDEGYSPENINLLYKALKKSGSNQWYEVTALYQNQALEHPVFIQEGVKEYIQSFEGQPKQPTFEQIQAKIQSLNSEFIQQKYAGARTEVLESSGVYKQMRSNTAAIVKGLYAENVKQQEIDLKDTLFKSLTAENRKTGAAGIMQIITTNPSKRKREQSLEWAANAVQSGGLKIDDAKSLLYKKFDQEQSLAERFPGRAEIINLQKAIQSAEQGIKQQFNAKQGAAKERAKLAQAEYFKGILDANGGVLTQEEWDAGNDIMRDAGFLDEETDVAKEVKPYIDSNLYSKTLDTQWTKTVRENGTYPSIEVIRNSPVNLSTRNKWIGLAEKRNDFKDLIKQQEDLIDDAVRAHTKLRPYKDAPSATVAMQAEDMKRDFRVALNNRVVYDGTMSEQQISTTIQEVGKMAVDKTILEREKSGAIDPRGRYVSQLSKIAEGAANQQEVTENNAGVVKFKLKNDFSRGALKQHTEASLGASGFYAARDALSEGKGVSARVRYNAKVFKMTPLDYINLLSEANGQTPVTYKSKWEAAIQNLPKKDYNWLNTYIDSASGPAIQRRVQHQMTGKPMPVRASATVYGASGYQGSRDVVDTGYKDASNRPVMLSPSAAFAWAEMVSAGMPVNSVDITNVYRDEEEYLRLKAEGYAPAANSTHNHGEGIDVHGPTGAWIRANGAKYGWYPNDYAGTHGGHYEFRQ